MSSLRSVGATALRVPIVAAGNAPRGEPAGAAPQNQGRITDDMGSEAMRRPSKLLPSER